jgi:hypothetical protein
MKLFHRTSSEFETFNPISFFTHLSPLSDTDYGSRVVEIEWTGKLATDADIIRVVSELELTEEGVEMPYEYLSPNLGEVPKSTVWEIVDALKKEGFDGARVRDFCCAESIVIFEEVDA